MRFTNLLNFVFDVIDQYSIGSDMTRVSIVRYSSIAEVLISLNQVTTKEMLATAVLDIEFVSGSKSTDAAIELAQQEFRNNGRRSAKRVLLIATDGQSNNPSATMFQANSAKGDGIEVFTLSIGPAANSNELSSIASSPISTHVFSATDFTARTLTSTVEDLNQGVCTGKIIILTL